MTRPHADPDLTSLLRAAGLRPTSQRRALARLLIEGGPRHLTAELLHAEARARKLKVSLATVYNTLHQFTEAGLVRELVVDAGRAYFDTNTSHHHHFYDESDGRLIDIPGDSVAVSALPVPPPGNEISRVDVVVRLRRKRAQPAG